MIVTTFVAVFYLSNGTPLLELHNQRSESMCKRQATSIVKNARLPGNLRLPGVHFKCVAREGRSS